MIAPTKRPNVVDSCAWLEYFAGSNGADPFARAIEAVDRLILHQSAYSKCSRSSFGNAAKAMRSRQFALMQQGTVVDLDSPLALAAAKIGVEHKLPLADSIVFATAQLTGAILSTQDADFDGLPDVQFFAKPAS